MRRRVLENRVVRNLLISGGATVAIVWGISLFFALRYPEKAGRLLPIVVVVVGIAIATVIAVALHARLAWRGQGALLVGFALVLLVLAFVPLFEWTLVERGTTLVGGLLLLLFGYLIRSW